MSVQIRVLVEIAPSETETAWVRLDQAETVIPANPNAEDANDTIALADMALCRVAGDCLTKARDQLVQMGDIVNEAISG